jgi:hypothetical protein
VAVGEVWLSVAVGEGWLSVAMGEGWLSGAVGKWFLEVVVGLRIEGEEEEAGAGRFYSRDSHRARAGILGWSGAGNRRRTGTLGTGGRYGLEEAGGGELLSGAGEVGGRLSGGGKVGGRLSGSGEVGGRLLRAEEDCTSIGCNTRTRGCFPRWGGSTLGRRRGSFAGYRQAWDRPL